MSDGTDFYTEYTDTYNAKRPPLTRPWASSTPITLPEFRVMVGAPAEMTPVEEASALQITRASRSK